MTTTRATITAVEGKPRPLAGPPGPTRTRLPAGEVALLATSLAILVLVVF